MGGCISGVLASRSSPRVPPPAVGGCPLPTTAGSVPGAGCCPPLSVGLGGRLESLWGAEVCEVGVLESLLC